MRKTRMTGGYSNEVNENPVLKWVKRQLCPTNIYGMALPNLFHAFA